MEDWIVEFMTTRGLLLVYGLVLVSAFLEYLFPPFPSDTFLLFAGVLAGEEVLDPFILFCLTMFGSMVGAICLYEIGRTKGRDFFIEKDYPFFPKNRIFRLEEWFARHGGKIIVVNRFFSGFRAVFFIAAGIGRMEFPKVVLYGALGSAIWTAIILMAGYMVGQNWTAVREYFGIYSTTIVGLVAILFLICLIRYFIRKRKIRSP